MANPWDPVQPPAAALVLERCLAAGVLTQDILDQSREESSCFGHVDELQRISAIKAEIQEKSLELELLSLEKEAADVSHPFYLSQKCQALQALNSHLEVVLKEKCSLRQRLAKPLCQENLPIEVPYHRSAAELLPLAVNFIEKLEDYIQNIKKIPQIPECRKNLDTALARMESVETDLEKLTEQILMCRERHNDHLQGRSDNAQPCSSGIKESTSYFSIENLHH